MEEFAWVNGMDIDPKDADKVNVKLVNNGKLKLFLSEKLDIRLMEGFELTNKEEEADLILGERVNDKPTLEPRHLVLGL
ncbi:MAG: cobalamin biosynthesis protein CbiG, partial [Metallosphaera sp.]